MGVGGNVVGTAVGKSVGSTVGSSVGTYVYHTARGSVAPGTASDMPQEVSDAPSDKKHEKKCPNTERRATDAVWAGLTGTDLKRRATDAVWAGLTGIDLKQVPRCVLRRGSSGATTCVESAA